MHGEKPNSIQSKLEELNQVPEGFSYNHTATWQKLEKNLQRDKQRNFRWWHYAAMLLLIASCLLFWKMNNVSEIQDNKEEKIVNTKSNLPQPGKTDTGHHNNNEIKLLVVEKLPLKKKDVHDKKETIQTEDLKDSIQLVADVLPEKMLNTNLNVAADSLNSAVKVKSTKQKFKIAHVNELKGSRLMPIQYEENSIVFKKPMLSSKNEEPLSKEEKILTAKKSRNIFSPVSSSQ